MKRFFVKLAIILFGKEIFGYLEEEAKNSQYQNLAPVVSTVKNFVNDIPVNVWQSLRSDDSKAKLREVLLQHDEKMALAGYNLGMEFVDKKMNEDFLLAPVEQEAYQLGKDVIIIYTDENPDNKKQITELLRQKRAPLLIASIDQLQYIANYSEKIDESTKAKLGLAFNISKQLVNTLD